MRILALVTDAFGGYGGIAQYNRDLLSAWSRTEFVKAMRILPRIAPGETSCGSDKIVQLRAKHHKGRYALKAVAECIRARPDVIFNGHLYHGPLALFLASCFGSKLISQLHGTEMWGDVSRRHLVPLVRSDRVLCVSRDTQARYRLRAADSADNSVVLPNTVGARFSPGDRSCARARFQLGDEYAILTVARLDAREGYKGHDRVIRLLPRILQRKPNAVYLIAGMGDDQPRLEAIVRGLGLDSKVRFLGKVPDADLPDLYRAADIFALPSTGEGFGIVFLEAMASGTPAIGLSVGGVPDALDNGRLGYCVRPEDFEEVFLRAIDSERPDAQRLSGAVQRQFGWKAFSDRAAEILSELDTAGAGVPERKWRMLK